ncbi:MAG: hypothetical protein AAGF93_00045 [Cyanobacteria bacterium P01_H01_bin.105]
MYDQRRKEILGAYLHEFLRDEDLWPESLVKWYKREERHMSAVSRSRGLTVELLLKYMSEHTGLNLMQPYYKSLLGNWTRWHQEPGRGGDNAALILALADCEIVYLDGIVFNRVKDLILWLQGEELSE